MPSDNLDIARRYLGDVWSRGHLDAVRDLVAPGCTVRDPLLGECVGVDALRNRVRETRSAFPDLAWSIDEVLADAGSQLALTWSASARAVKVSGMLLLRFEEGKLIAISGHWDPYELLRQQPPRAPRLARGSQTAIATRFDDSDVDAHWEL